MAARPQRPSRPGGLHFRSPPPAAPYRGAGCWPSLLSPPLRPTWAALLIVEAASTVALGQQGWAASAADRGRCGQALLAASALAAPSMAWLGYAGGERLGHFGDVGVDQSTFCAGGVPVVRRDRRADRGDVRRPDPQARPVAPPQPAPVEPDSGNRARVRGRGRGYAGEDIEDLEYVEGGSQPELEPDQPLVSGRPRRPRQSPTCRKPSPTSMTTTAWTGSSRQYDDVQETVYEPGPRAMKTSMTIPRTTSSSTTTLTGDQPRRGSTRLAARAATVTCASECTGTAGSAGSGTGSLLASLLAAAADDYPARVVAVGTDRNVPRWTSRHRRESRLHRAARRPCGPRRLGCRTHRGPPRNTSRT